MTCPLVAHTYTHIRTHTCTHTQVELTKGRYTDKRAVVVGFGGGSACARARKHTQLDIGWLAGKYTAGELVGMRR